VAPNATEPTTNVDVSIASVTTPAIVASRVRRARPA
jgi:hypothetical protein